MDDRPNRDTEEPKKAEIHENGRRSIHEDVEVIEIIHVEDNSNNQHMKSMTSESCYEYENSLRSENSGKETITKDLRYLSNWIDMMSTDNHHTEDLRYDCTREMQYDVNRL